MRCFNYTGLLVAKLLGGTRVTGHVFRFRVSLVAFGKEVHREVRLYGLKIYAFCFEVNYKRLKELAVTSVAILLSHQ